MICIVLSVFVIHPVAVIAADLECQVDDFQNYTDSIKDCDAVKTLKFNVTNWVPIPQDLINRTRSINSIDVNNRSIEIIDENGFCAWPKLTAINAGRNKILTLPTDLLANCRVLNSLSLAKNRIGLIEEDAFRRLPFLTELDLSSNQIDTLDDNVFKSLISLKTLRLNNNKIQAISVDNFAYTTKLETLDLSYNSIQTIEEGSFWNLRKLVTLDMSHNLDLNALDLTQMDRLQNVNIDNASLEQLNIPESVVQISANSNKITKLAIAPNGILEELHLRNNYLPTLKELSMAGQLTALDVSYNNIRDVDFSYLYTTQIQRLVIVGNPIRTFNVSTLINLPYLRTVEISTDSLDKETMSELEDGTSLLYNLVRAPIKTPERRNVVEITESTYAPSTESSSIFKSTTEISMRKKSRDSMVTIQPTPITDDSTFETLAGDDTKDDMIIKLLDRIQRLESNQGNSSEQRRQTEQTVSDLRILIVCTIIAFSLFVSFQIGLFVYENYKQWNIPLPVSIPNVIASSQNGVAHNRHGRTTANDGALDPIIEDVF